MFSFVNNVVRTIFTSIILILCFEVIIVHGQDIGSYSSNEEEFVAKSPLNNYDSIPDFRDALNKNFQGTTLQYIDLLSIISGSRMSDNQYEFQLRPDVDNFLGNRLIIGQLNNVNQILYVQISFHMDNGDLIRDDDGNPIIYKSTRQEIGHVLDIVHQDFTFSYVECLLQLEPNSNFDSHSLFFHFAQPPTPTSTELPIPTSTQPPIPTNIQLPIPTSTQLPIPTSTETSLPTSTQLPIPTSTQPPIPASTQPSIPTNIQALNQ